jgi:hypothetical protein
VRRAAERERTIRRGRRESAAVTGVERVDPVLPAALDRAVSTATIVAVAAAPSAVVVCASVAAAPSAVVVRASVAADIAARRAERP